MGKNVSWASKLWRRVGSGVEYWYSNYKSADIHRLRFWTFSSIRVIRGGRLGGSGTHTHPNYPHCVYRVSHLILTSSRYYCFEKLICWDIFVLLIIAQTLFSLSGIQINIIPIKIIFSNTDISKIKILSKSTILYTSLARRIWSCIDKN